MHECPSGQCRARAGAAAVRGLVAVPVWWAWPTGVGAVESAGEVDVARLVVGRATARAGLARRPEAVTLLASADHPEDHACATYIEGLLRGEEPDVDSLLQPLRASARFARAKSGTWPGFPPTDLELALITDRFDFAMPA